MYTIYSLQLHELHEYNFSNHPWNLFAQLNNDPRFFFTVEGAKLRDQVAAHFHFWCLKRKRKVAEGNCKRVQWRGRPGRERTVSPRGGLTSCGLITSFLGRKVGGPWLNTGRERKLVVKHWRGGRGPSIHPPPSSKRETYFRSARAQTYEDGVYRKPRRRKQFFEYSTGILKKLFS